MIERANLLVFRRTDLPMVLASFGWSANERGRLIDEEGKTLVCSCCKRKLTEDNLGNIVPGSTLPLCDNPMCFSEFAARID